jgi:spermidine synthase
MSDGAILQQWIQLHHIDRREIGVVLRTIRTAFEHVALFFSGNQGLIIASSRPLVVSRAHLAELGARAQVQDTLGDAPTLEALLDRMILSGAELDRFVAESGPPTLSTDDNLYLEYATPRGNVLDYWKSINEVVRLLHAYRSPHVPARHVVD